MTQQQFELNQEREAELYCALDEAWEKGLSPKSMEILLFETGASQWKPQNHAYKRVDARAVSLA